MKCDICGKEAKTWGHCVCLECYTTPRAKDKQLAIYKLALQLENEERFKNIDGIWMIKNGKRTKFINNAEELTNYYLDQAKKELEEQDG